MERKLTSGHLERGSFHEHLTHLQHKAGLNEHGMERVNGAISAALAHVEKKHDLKRGMAAHHVDEALRFLDSEHFSGRHDLKDKERRVIADSLKSRFNIKEPDQEAA